MRKMTKIISVILTVIMFFGVFSAANPVIAAEVQEITENTTQETPDSETTESVNAETAETETEETETPTVESKPQIIGEDESRRDETTKHFIMSDGSRRAVRYAQAVHYKENGNWVDIDNTLTYDTEKEEYRNKKNSFEVSLKKDFSSEKLLTIENKGYTLSWEYQNGGIRSKFVNAEVENNEKTEDDFVKHIKKSRSKIKYKEFESNCELEYVVTGTGVKENIILNSKTNKNEFSFRVNAPDLILIKNDDGSISAKAADDTEIFYIPAPYMFDSSNEYSESVEYELIKENNSEYTVKIVADKNWLNDENRVYPVTIDPVIETKRIKSAITTTFVTSGHPDTNMNEMQAVYIGVESADYLKCRTLVKMTLPTLNKGDMVVGASLVMCQYASSFYHDYMPDQQIDACLIKDSWNASTVTWNTMPDIKDYIYDYSYIKRDSNWRQFDITRAVKGWYEGTVTNNGIMIKKHVEDGAFSDVAARGIFWSDKYNGNENLFPYIAVNYRNNKGLESYWSFSSFSAGDTTGSVNDYSGNLVYEIPLVSSVSEILPVSMSLVYNGYAASQKYVSGKDGSFLTTPGKGWKVNIQETIIPSSKYGLSEEEAKIYPYVYTDGDGTEHYFKEVTRKNDEDEEETVYEDEDGLGLTLDDVATSTYTYKITDKQDNERLFNAKGNLGIIKDAKGNRIIISYNGDKNKITKVTDGTGHTFTFGYGVNDDGTENNYLKTITDNAGRVTKINSVNGYIASVKHFDGTLISVHYESEGENRENLYNENFEGLINYVKTSDGNGLNFNYNEKSKGRRVAKVTELGTSNGNTVYGQAVTFDRSIYNTTVIRSAGIDGIHKDENSDNAADDIVTTLQFNNSGLPVSQQVSYGNGNAVGAGTYNYENNKAGSKNKITDAASLGKNTVNLLKNPNAESKENWTAGTTDDITANNYLGSQQYTGNYSLYLNTSSITSDEANHFFKQTVSGKYKAGEKYTLSAFVKTENLVQKGSADLRGAHIQLKAYDSNGNSHASVFSQAITADTDNEINGGWRRLIVTIEIPENVTITALRVYLCLRNATGKAFFDCMQLEKGSVPNSVNLLENSSFEDVDSDGTPVGWGTLDDTDKNVDKTTTDAHKDGARNLIIYGEANKSKAYYQRVAVEGNENDTYIVSGWSAAYAVSPSHHSHYEKDGEKISDDDAEKILTNTNKKDDEDIELVENTKYEIAVRVIYQKTDANGNSEQVKQFKDSAKFNPCVSRSQYTSIPVCLKYTDGEEGYTYTPTHIAVILRYINQANYAYFDQIQVIKDVAQSYVYDSEGNLVSVSANAEQKNNMEYDGEDNLKTYKDAIGSKTTFEYEKGTHNLTKVTSPKGLTTTYHYNDEEQPYATVTTGVDDAGKIKTGTGYTDASGNISKGAYVAYTTDEHGYKTSSTYNMPTGALKTITDANGNVTTYSYDDTYSKIKSVTGKNTKVSYSYDGNRLSQILFGGTESTARSETYSFEYNAFGNMKSTKVGERALVTNTYGENNGMLSHITYGNGDGIKYNYDKSGNKTAVYKRDDSTTFNENASYRWSFSPNGIPRTHTDGANNRKYTYSYDSIGRLIRQDIAKSTDGSAVGSTEFGYNSRGHLTSVTNKIGGRTYGQYYKYTKVTDDNGKDIDGSLANAKEGLSTRYRALGVNTDYTYDGLNRLDKKTVNLETDLVTDYSYKASARTEGTYTTNQLASELIGAARYNYTYDKNGNITEIKKGSSEYRSYTYDSLGQLKRENNTTSKTTTIYTHDVLGNINTKKEYAYTTGDVGTATKNIAYHYGDDGGNAWDYLLVDVDLNGNGKVDTDEKITYDNIGNPKKYLGATMTWYGRQMTSYEKGSVSATFKYDADGLRGSKKVNKVTTTYQYVGDQLFYEDKGNGIELYFFYDSFGDLNCIRYIKTADDGTVTTRTYYTATNAQGDVVSIFHDSGNLLARYDYDAWGNVVAIRNADGNTLTPTKNPGHIAILNPIRYRGYYYDNDLGLYYLQSRYYDATIGRFISADSVISGVGGDVLGNNLFAYCGNNPVVRVDYGGQFWDTVFDVVSLVVSVAEVVINPTSVSAWVGLAADIVCTVVPGLTGGGALVKAVSKADDVVDAVKVVNKVDDIVDTTKTAKKAVKVHGNSLKSPKTNYGYALVDRDNNIMKFGETVNPRTRYSQKYLNQNGYSMKILESGSKADIHYWQYDMNMYYRSRYGSFPPLNKRGW